MAFGFTSPWTDAAAYGNALGDKLAEALIRMPMMKKQMEMEQASLQQRMQQQGFENRMEQGRLAESQRYHQDEMAMRKTENDRQAKRDELTDAWHKEEVAERTKHNRQTELGTALRQHQTDAYHSAALAQKRESAAQSNAIAKGRLDLAKQTQEAKFGDAIATHILKDPVALSKLQTDNPPLYNTLMQRSQSALGGQQQQAAPRIVRVAHPNGQTGTIPESQVQEAVVSGYKLIQ